MNRLLVAVVAAVLIAAPPVGAAPAPTPPPVDGGASVQTLEPSRPSTPARDEQFLPTSLAPGYGSATSLQSSMGLTTPAPISLRDTMQSRPWIPGCITTRR